MARDPLEDYAEGIGAGALPQQGSMLPLQGGLPFGASPQQAPPPMPAPAFGAIPQTPRAPLTSIGGMAPDPEQMLAERLQRFTAPTAPGLSGMRDRDMLMEEIKALSSAASIRSQERISQEKNVGELTKLPLEFHEKFTPEEQERVRPIFQRLIRARADLSKVPVDDALINETLTSPDLAKTYADLLNDPLVGPEERQGYLSRLGGVRGEKRSAERGRVDMEIGQKALSLIQSKLPEELARLGGSAKTPLDVQKFLLDPQVKQYMSQSPILKRTFNAFINDKNNAEALANLGLDVSGLKRQEQQMKGPELTGEVKDALAQMKGPDGKPIIPSIATPEQIKMAKTQVFNEKLDISKHQGFNAVIAKAEGERNIPLIQMDGMKDTHFVNKKTEMPVDRIQSTLDNLQRGGGEEKFAAMNQKSFEAFMAAKEADGVLGQYLDIARSLTNTPGANLLQVAAFYAKTKLGVDNPGVGFEALRGSVLRMARAMQGSSQSLSNLDANAVAGMLPSEMDSVPTALKRLEISAKLIQNMKDTQLGKVQPTSLLAQIEEAKHSIAKLQGTVITDGKQKAVIPKGQSVPKGWKVVE